MKFTTSCERAASNAPSANGSASALATTTSTPGSRARHASTNGSDGSAAAHARLPEPLRERGRERARPAADVEGAHPGLDAREGDQRRRELRAVAADVPVVGVGRCAEGLSAGHRIARLPFRHGMAPASGCPRRARGVLADADRERERRRARRRGPAVRAQHRHRRDRLVLFAGARRPRRRQPAGDRRAVLLARSSSTRRAVCWARARRPKGGSTPRAWSPISTATACARSSSAATRGRSRPTTSVGGRLQLKPGWPASTCSGGQCPETRGLAAADLDGDGRIEVVATTTNTSPTGSQVFVFEPLRRAARRRLAAVQRRRRRASTASATTATAPTARTSGSATSTTTRSCEVVVTFDNHQINVFNHDGTSVLASPWYTNRESGHAGQPARLGPVHPLAEPARRGRPLPPPRRRLARRAQDAVAAVDRLAAVDRRPRPRRRATRSSALPNVEKKEPYETQAYAFMVLDGAYGYGRALGVAGTRASGSCR